jgi:hypothetical protein
MTNHETRCWRAKPYDGRGDFFSLAEASDWRPSGSKAWLTGGMFAYGALPEVDDLFRR